MNATVSTYDAKQISVSFGSLILTGFADDAVVTIERADDAFVTKRGADGSVERSNKNVFNHRVTVTLLQTSPSNKELYNLFNLDLTTNAGKLPLMVKDLNGDALAAFAEAWVAVPPNIEYSGETTNREWVFETGPGIVTVGSLLF